MNSCCFPEYLLKMASLLSSVFDPLLACDGSYGLTYTGHETKALYKGRGVIEPVFA